MSNQRDKFVADVLNLKPTDLFEFSAKLSGWEELAQRDVIIWGAGLFGESVANILLHEGITPLFFIDSDNFKIGKQYRGITVRRVEDIDLHPNAVVIPTSAYARQMAEVCVEKGFEILLPIDFPPTSMMVPAIGCRSKDLDFDKIDSLLSILDDNESQKAVLAYLKFQLTLDLRFVNEVFTPNPYFAKDMLDVIDYSSFCDLGASIGDTYSEYMKHIHPKKELYTYYAFEPDLPSYQKMALTTPARENVVLVWGACGDVDGVLNLYSDGVGSFCFDDFKINNSYTVPCFKLDTFFTNKFPTVIKADVEGYELNVLCGARSLIATYKPDLIFSIYHRIDDLWNIPLFIHNLNAGYKIHIRQQSRTYGETLCYATCRY